MTVRTSYSFHQYAGAYEVAASAIPELQPGMLVEFARYSGPDLHIYNVETGDEIVEPIARLDVETIGSDRWRFVRDSKLLLEVTSPTIDFRQRSFEPPRGYRLLTRFIRPRVPWPDPPRWMSLEEIVRT
jgi:hypothetical protein